MCAKTVKPSTQQELWKHYRRVMQFTKPIYNNSPVVETLGYANKQAREIIDDFVKKERSIIVGVGYPLNDWAPEWEWEEMQKEYKNKFVGIFELHNFTFSLKKELYNRFEPYQDSFIIRQLYKMGYYPVDYERGFRKLLEVCRRFKNVMLLCSEIDESICHRSILKQELSHFMNIN